MIFVNIITSNKLLELSIYSLGNIQKRTGKCLSQYTMILFSHSEINHF